MGLTKQLLVIKEEDFVKFGCPHCGGIDDENFLSFGSFSMCCCENCGHEYAMVKESCKELYVRRNTDIQDLIGHHPYKREKDLMTAAPLFSMPKNFSCVLEKKA